MTTNRSLNARYTPAQQAFLLSIAGTAHSQLTPAHHAAAARVGMAFPKMSYPQSQPLPAKVTYRDVVASW